MEICDSMCLTLCLYYLTSRETRLHILNQNPLKISYELTITRKVVIFSSANSSLGGRHFRYCKLMPKCVQPRNLNNELTLKGPMIDEKAWLWVEFNLTIRWIHLPSSVNVRITLTAQKKDDWWWQRILILPNICLLSLIK